MQMSSETQRQPRPRAPVVFTLLESRRHPAFMPSLSALISIAAHASVIAGVLIASSFVTEFTTEDHERAVRFLYPLLQPAPRPIQEQVNYVGLNGAPALVSAAPPTVAAPAPPLVPVPAPAPEPRIADGEPPEPPRAFSELEVDSTAMHDPNSEGPVYPPTLLAKSIEGTALVRFVVGADGLVDLSTFRAIKSTDTLFTKAARDALPRMKFRPAWFAGRPVSQLVEQAFTFRIARSPP